MQNYSNMSVHYINSKVDWWVYLVLIGTALIGYLLPLLDGDWLLAIIFGTSMLALEIFCFASVKYAVRGNELGVRMFWRWTWLPIDKIQEVKKVTGILSTAANSVHRVSIKFSDRKILKSYAPLEISPSDRDAFIAELKAINPAIEVKQ